MSRSLTICYTSDVHGYFSPTDYASGRAVASGLANCAARFPHDGNSLIIDGGDVLQGSPLTYYLRSRGDPDCLPARVMNLAGYDFVTLGNHDFNYGADTLRTYLEALDAVCLCANVEGLPGVEKTAVVEMENGLRVGLTGLTTPFIHVWEKPENLEGIRITDPMAAGEQALDELRAAKVDLTVCIYHGGFENDLVSGELLSDTEENHGWRLCRNLDFDILLSGHQHVPRENICLFGTSTCSPPDKARSFIRMEVTAEDGGRVRVRSGLTEAGNETLPALKSLLAPVEDALAAWLDTPMGHLDVPLLPEAHITMAEKGSLIANFFNQVQLEASGADISCTSLGNEVKGFAADVTIRDVVSTYVYPNTLKTLEVDRAVLKAALERSAEYFSLDENGELTVADSFLRPKVEHYNYDYFSGIETVVDVRRPLGQRVLSIRYHGEELAKDRTLRLCINNYRATGAGGYDRYLLCPLLKEQPNEIAEMIMEYISVHRNITVDKTRYVTVLY